MYANVELCEDSILVSVYAGRGSSSSLHMPSGQPKKNGKLFIGWDHTKAKCESEKAAETRRFSRAGGDEKLKAYLTEQMQKRGESAIECILVAKSDGFVNGSSSGIISGTTFQQVGFVRDVKLTERSLAGAAFYTEAHRKETGTDYKGYLLVVDGQKEGFEATVFQAGRAGECTLLEPVAHQRQKTDSLERNYLSRMLMEAGIRADAGTLKTESWKKCCLEWKERLQEKRTIIQECFDEYGIDFPEDLEQVIGTVSWKGASYSVTCAHLLRAYQMTVQKELDMWLDQVLVKLKNSGAPYWERRGDIFRICLCGWVREHELAVRQIEEKFRMSTMDKRRTQVQPEYSPVAAGAAMLAAEAVKVGASAPCSVFVPGIERQDAILKQGDILEFEKTYSPVSPEDGKEYQYIATVREMPRVVLRQKGKPDETMMISAGDAQRKAWGTGGVIVRIGVSFHPSGQFRIHYSY